MPLRSTTPIDAAKHSDVALEFETGGLLLENGKEIDAASISRRSSEMVLVARKSELAG